MSLFGILDGARSAASTAATSRRKKTFAVVASLPPYSFLLVDYDSAVVSLCARSGSVDPHPSSSTSRGEADAGAMAPTSSIVDASCYLVLLLVAAREAQLVSSSPTTAAKATASASAATTSAAGTEATSVVTTPSRPPVPGALRDQIDAFPRRIALSCALRLVWIGFEVFGLWQEGNITPCRDPHLLVEFTGRLAQLAFFSSFLNLLVLWADVLRADDERLSAAALSPGADSSATLAAALARSAMRVNNGGAVAHDGDSAAAMRLHAPPSLWKVLCVPQTLQVLFNFWVWILVLSLFLLRFESCTASSRVSDAQTVALAAAYALLGIGFLIVSLRLAPRLSRLPRVRRRIIIVSTCCVVCFVGRAGLFLVRPISGYRFEGLAERVLYPWFFYTVPEIVPSLVVFACTHRRGAVPDAVGPPTETTALLP